MFVRKTIKFITFIIISVILLFVVSCSRESTNKIYNIDMSGVVFEDKTYTYDGNVHNIYISGTIPSGVIVSYTGNSKVNVGTYEVTASFKLANGYTKVADMKANMIIEKTAVTGIKFESQTFEYDGLPHSLAIEGELPESINVDYRYNSAIDVGTYEVEAHFSSTETNSNFVVPEPMKAKMTIVRKLIDNISFENQTFEYDGKIHSIGITGELPMGVNVNYVGNGKSKVGEYEVKANFNDTTGNYDISNMTAIMTIEKVNVSGIVFKNSSVLFDGSEHSIEVSNLPEGVEVSYSPTNTFINAGRHVVTASFKDKTGNYNVPDDMTATLTIAQKSLPVEFNSKEVTYDGLEHSIEIEDSLPEGITVSYSKNSYMDAGVYEVTASFEDSNNNYIIDDITATLTINKADLTGLKLENKTVTYDGTPKSIEITGELDDSISSLTEYTNEYKNNNKTNAGTYYVYATITPSNNNFNRLILNAVLTINKAEITGISIDDLTVDYDGTPKSIHVKGDIPAGVVVDYYYNGNILDPGEEGVKQAGVYTVKAVLREEITANYNSSEDLTATLTINKIKPATDIVFEDGLFIYDNKPHSIFIDEDNLPAHIRVSKYTNNAATQMGEYVVVAYLVDESGNYDVPDHISATMRIYHLEDGIYYVGNEQTPTATVVGCKDEVTEVEIKNNISVPYIENGIEKTASYSVIGIEVGALKDTDNRHITKISVPHSIKNLEKGVFSGSSSLESISLPFVGNKNEDDQYPFGYIFGTEAYEDALPTRQVYKTENDTLGDTVYYIPSSLKSITIGDSLNCQEFIPYGSFSYLTNVENIEIGPAEEISDSAFEGISGLKNLKVPYLGSSGESKTLGYLFGSFGYYGGTQVIQNNNTYFYPETLETVNIYLATTVGAEAFRNCSLLKNILIPKTIINIGNYAFNGCNKKLKICYKGNSEDFATIVKGDNNELLNTNVYYYTEDPENEAGAMWWYYGPNGEIYTKVLVTFESNGGTEYSPYAVLMFDKIQEKTPSKNYNIFEGWYTDSEFNEKFDFNTPVIENITLYAKWTEHLAYELVDDDTSTVGDEYYVVTGIGGITSLDIIIPDTFNNLPVKAIGKQVFEYNKNIKSITIGSNLKEIGASAFHDCDGLTGSIVIPDNVTTIGSCAFSDCAFITKVIFGRGLKTIKNDAFLGCGSLTEIIIPDNVTELGSYAFKDCYGAESITIGKGIKTIYEYTFKNCNNAKTLVLSEGLEKIGDYAFAECKSLTEIIIPDSVNKIYNHAFFKCNNAKTLVLSEGLKEIGASAFEECSSLTEIIIPDSVNTMGSEAFYHCYGLTSITIGTGLETIPYRAFLTWEKAPISEVIFKAPSKVKILGGECFAHIGSMDRFIIPDSVTTISEGALSNCSFKEIVLGSGVKQIDEAAFNNCSKLTTVYYKGTSRSNITTIDPDYNAPLNNATWYYWTNVGASETGNGNWWYYDSNNNIKTVVNKPVVN